MRVSSSTAIAYESVSAPAPPYSSGIVIPISPSSASSSTRSYGKRCSRSSSCRDGATRSRANSRTVSRTSCCSSVRSKFKRTRRRRELGDQAHAVAGAAGLPEVVAARAVEEGGAGDVEVRPRPLARELLEELGGEHRRALAQVRRVLHVGVCRLDVAPVARVEREPPQVVAARLAGVEDLLGPGVVVREDARRRSRRARTPSRRSASRDP